MKPIQKAILAACIFIFVLAALSSIIHKFKSESSCGSPIDWVAYEREASYWRNETKTLYGETGIPEEYSCEEIEEMIKTNNYPTHTSIFICRSCEFCEWEWCANSLDFDTKGDFVGYYVNKCVEGSE